MQQYTTYLICIFFLTFSQLASATDVFLAELKSDNGQMKVTNVENVSAKPGYDNQPFFAPNGKGLYYTSTQPGVDQAEQTDSVYFDFNSGKTINVTNTQTVSEFSPTVMADGKHISFIHQDAKNKQWLYRANIKTGEQTIINPYVEPVGYHAWGAKNDMALFVLGDVMTLQYFPDKNKAEKQIVAENIGRSIRFNAELQLFSFSQGTDKQHFSVFYPATGFTQQLLALPGNSQYYTWLDATTVISASKNKVWQWTFNLENRGKWRPYLDLSTYCTTEVTRLAVNNDKSRIAFVCDEK